MLTSEVLEVARKYRKQVQVPKLCAGSEINECRWSTTLNTLKSFETVMRTATNIPVILEIYHQTDHFSKDEMQPPDFTTSSPLPVHIFSYPFRPVPSPGSLFPSPRIGYPGNSTRYLALPCDSTIPTSSQMVED